MDILISNQSAPKSGIIINYSKFRFLSYLILLLYYLPIVQLQSCSLFLPNTQYCIACPSDKILIVVYDNQTAYCGAVNETVTRTVGVQQWCWLDYYYDQLLMNQQGRYYTVMNSYISEGLSLGYNVSYSEYKFALVSVFQKYTIENISFCMCSVNLQVNQTSDETCSNTNWIALLVEYQSIQKYGYNNGGQCMTGNRLHQTISPLLPGVFYFLIFWNSTVGNQPCYVMEVYNPVINQCVNCSSIFPNCAACTQDACTICIDGYFWNPNYYNQTLGMIAGTCLLDGCPIGYGPIYGTTLCSQCQIQNCDICNYTLTGYTLNSQEYMYDMVLSGGLCRRCAKGYRLNSTSGQCSYIQNLTLTLNFVVQSIMNFTDITTLEYSSSPQFYHLSTNNYSLPFFSISQILGVMRQLYENGTYYQLNATIYLSSGNNYFFYCDNPNNYLDDFCTNQKTNTLFYQYPFDTDNIYLIIKPLECSEISNLNFVIDQSLCVNLTIGPKPKLFLMQQWAYFNQSGYTLFENIIFTGQAQLFSQNLLSPDSYAYFLDALVNQTDTENGFYFFMSAIGNQLLYNEAPNWSYSYKTISPNDQNTNSKCIQNGYSQFYQQRESLQQCQGEPNHPLFFSNFTISTTINATVQDITRTYAVFNLYAFDAYRSTRNQLPELRIMGCEFQYFLSNYTALVTIQTNNFRQRVNTIIHSTTQFTYHQYHYYGSDKGIKLYINNSIFGNSSFCKGLISYQKKINISNSYMVGDYSTYYQPNVINDSPYVIIDNSSFTNLYAYNNVTALAYMAYGESFTYSFLSERAPMQYRLTTHRGMVLNFNGFPGQVEIKDSSIYRNKILIPEIIIGEQSSSTSKNDYIFKDQVHYEYKMSICSQQTLSNSYFFDDGFDSTVDLDTFFDYFERLSTIYISENTGNVIIRNNNFSQNIGSFGGAITINSQNWRQTNQSYIIVVNNSFSNNMAYFAGNAIYIRNTRLENNFSKQCGGVYMNNNSFIHNIGLKKHNGGAIAAYCYIISSSLHDDYYATSEYYFDNAQNQSAIISDIVDPTIVYQIPLYAFTIEYSLFQENFSGLKGSALYIRQMSQIQILSCTFLGNKPSIQYYEILYSPYYYFLPNRTLSYTNSNPLCSDELSFMANCKNINNLIDWPHTQGAVYISHCQTNDCFIQHITNQNQMQLLISNSILQDNKACPIIDEFFPTDLATSLYIEGGINNTISQTQFYSKQSNIFNSIPDIYQQFFPIGYLDQTQSPHIYVSVTPVLTLTDSYNFSTFLNGCQFQGNRNIQILGVPNGYLSTSALISFITTYSAYYNTYIPTLSLFNCTITNNTFKGEQTSLIYVYNGILNIIDSIFTNNGYLSNSFYTNSIISSYYQNYNQQTSQEYGIIYLDVTELFLGQVAHMIEGNTFNYTYAQTGSVFYLDIRQQYITMIDNSFNFNFAQIGSILYFDAQSYFNVISMIGGLINQNYNQQEGTIYIVNNNYGSVMLQISNYTFTNCYSQTGGSLYLDSIAKLIAANTNFYYDGYTDILNLLSTYLSDFNYVQTDFYDQSYLLSITNKHSKASNGGQIYMINVFNPYNYSTPNQDFQYSDNSFSAFVNVEFSNLYSQESTLIQSSGSNIYFSNNPILNLSMRNISQIAYGVISIEAQSQFVGSGLQIMNCNTDYSASLFYISNSSFSCTSCLFVNNTAQQFGSIYVEINSWFTCNYCNFLNNYAYDSSILYGIQNSATTIVFNNSIFVNNTSTQNLATLISSNLDLTSCDLTDNIASSYNLGITAEGSTVIAQNVIVNFTNAEYLQETSSPTDYGFIFASSKSTVNISQSQFINLKGSISSILDITGQGYAYITDSMFINCESQNGATFYISDSTQSSLINATFINNTQIDINVDDSSILVSGSLFSQTSLQSIYLQDSNASIFQSTFSNGENIFINGKAIYCDCIYLLVDQCSFSNLSALEGGAIYLTESNTDSSFIISNSTFTSNLAQQGGAIKIQDALNLTLISNQFQLNSALYLNEQTGVALSLEQKGIGGAIYMDCSNSALDINSNCLISLKQNNSFSYNFAQNDGGAIKYVSTPYIDDNTTSFSNNNAFYGNNVASYPKSIKPVFITNRDESSLYDNSSEASSNSIFPYVVSGTPFNILIQILDQADQVYTTDSSSKATFISIGSNSVLLQNFQTIAQNGVYNFSELTILAEPNSTVTLQLQIQGLETYSNIVSFVETSVEYKFYLRPCVIGEEYSQNKSCSVCPYNTYLLKQASTPTECLDCPSSAICYGGTDIFPISHYWRPNRTTDSFTLCQNTQACIGGNDTLNTNDICFEGYEGVICGICTINYQQTSVFTCNQCPQKVRNIVQIVFIILLCIGLVIYLVRSSILNAHRPKSAYSVYLKIMVNHFQVILAISNIQYQWPQQIEKFYDGEVKVSSYSTKIFSVDCFLNDAGLIQKDLSIFFMKLIMYGVLPLALTIISVLFWNIIIIAKGSRMKYRKYIITTITILLFLIHPDVAQEMLTAFNCINVDGQNYLRHDVSTICYQGSHLTMIYAVALPALVLWGLGIPTVGLITLIRNRKLIKQMDQKQEDLSSVEIRDIMDFKLKYGFLQYGFTSKFYFWEIIIVYRKIGIIMTTVFLSTISQTIQIWAALFIVIICVVLQLQYQPYFSSTLNKMEAFSLIVQSCTLYSGLFYLVEKDDYFINYNWVKWFFLFVLITPNIVFFIYWGFFISFELLKEIHMMNRKLFNIVVCGIVDYDQFYKKHIANQDEGHSNNNTGASPQQLKEEEANLSNRNLIRSKERKTSKVKIQSTKKIGQNNRKKTDVFEEASIPQGQTMVEETKRQGNKLILKSLHQDFDFNQFQITSDHDEAEVSKPQRKKLKVSKKYSKRNTPGSKSE